MPHLSWTLIRSTAESIDDDLDELAQAIRTAGQNYWPSHRERNEHLGVVRRLGSDVVHDRYRELRAAIDAQLRGVHSRLPKVNASEIVELQFWKDSARDALSGLDPGGVARVLERDLTAGASDIAIEAYIAAAERAVDGAGMTAHPVVLAIRRLMTPALRARVGRRAAAHELEARVGFLDLGGNVLARLQRAGRDDPRGSVTVFTADRSRTPPEASVGIHRDGAGRGHYARWADETEERAETAGDRAVANTQPDAPTERRAQSGSELLAAVDSQLAAQLAANAQFADQLARDPRTQQLDQGDDNDGGESDRPFRSQDRRPMRRR